VRDHVLGFEAVNGLGEVFVAGGKVLKNVTGFDLPKLLAGSWGTLAVLTELSLKALPMAPDSGSLVIARLTIADAVAAMTRALQGNVPITGAAHLPGHPARTVLRLEGPTSVLAVQRHAIAAMLALPADWIDASASAVLWHDIGAVRPFVADDTAVLWRVVMPATSAPALAEGLGDRGGVLLDWGGGLAWIWHGSDAPVDVRALSAVAGGHATLVRAPDAMKDSVRVFPPLPPAHGALQARVRAAFDPMGRFNPGRMGD
jgi:glycolate oxidase FAD binding subunit